MEILKLHNKGGGFYRKEDETVHLRNGRMLRRSLSWKNDIVNNVTTDS